MTAESSVTAETDARSRVLRTRLVNDLGASEAATSKSTALLAEGIRRKILTGELPEGTALPVERVLAADTGTSRTAVREALRLLEAQGLTYTKPGRGGGSFVRIPTADTMEHYLSVFIAGREIDFSSLVVVREALEPLGAALAAARRTDAQLERIEGVLDAYEKAFDDIPRFLTLNAKWHVEVAEASQNQLLHAIILSLSNAILQGTGADEFASERVRKSAILGHRSVVDAIREKNPERARRCMSRHLDAYREEVELYVAPPDLDAASRKSMGQSS